MKIKEIAFACYAVRNLKKAREFYEGVLGLVPTSEWVQSDTNGMIEYDIASGTLAIGAGADNFKPSTEGATIALEVEDFEEAMKELKAAGVKFNVEPMDTSVCFMAVVQDPDGNAVIMHKRKK